MVWVLLIFVVLFFVVVVVTRLTDSVDRSIGNPTEYDAETDSTEDSPSEVTPAPSTPGDEKTEPSCLKGVFLLLAIILIGFGIYFSVGLFRFLEGLGKFFGGVKDFFDAVESVFKGG